MQYNGDQHLPFPTKEGRGIGANDIPGASSQPRIRGGAALRPEDTGRAAAIRPRAAPFDIINPVAGPQGDGKLRMSRHGMYVVDLKRNGPCMDVAGVKKLAAKGEESIQVIWPKDAGLWASYDHRNRSLDTAGIAQGAANARRARLQALDRAQIDALMAPAPGTQPWQAPYKNKSDVFTHLVDDPRDRQGKGTPASKAQSTRGLSSRGADALSRQGADEVLQGDPRDYLDKMMQASADHQAGATGDPAQAGYEVSQDIAARQLQPVVLSGTPEGQEKSYGAPARARGGAQPSGKRVLKEAITFAQGKERIFGTADPSKAAPADKRAGKRVLT